MEEFANNLKKLRQSRGYTCQKLSDLLFEKAGLEISDRTLYNYEKDRREPNLKTLVSIAKTFNISIDTLLGHKAYSEDSIEISDLEEIQEKIDKMKKTIALSKRSI